MSRQRDAELDRLRSARESARQQQQAAWRAQQAAWERRSSARAVMNRAYETKQAAYADQQAAWEAYVSIKQTNGPRIDSLNAQQERAYQNMKSAFESASLAHDMHDGASARMYADQGHAYKAESQTCVAERRQLVAEIRVARERFDAVKPAFQAAKSEFACARQAFLSAKTEHERAQAEFKRAKVEFDLCAKAFKARLDELKSASRKRREDKKSLAARAGVPLQYQDNVWISTDSNGNTNIYFGGVGKPNGPGHGHYVMDRSGTVTYRRDPFDPHGAQNFEKSDLYMRSARRDHEPAGTNEHGGVFYRRSDSSGTILHVTQYFADGYHVSWDATPYGNSNVHWTNKNFPKGHPDRFVPPPDALFT